MVNSSGNGLPVHLAATGWILRCVGVYIRSEHSSGVHDWVHDPRWSRVEHCYLDGKWGFITQVNLTATILSHFELKLDFSLLNIHEP